MYMTYPDIDFVSNKGDTQLVFSGLRILIEKGAIWGPCWIPMWTVNLALNPENEKKMDGRNVLCIKNDGL